MPRCMNVCTHVWGTRGMGWESVSLITDYQFCCVRRLRILHVVNRTVYVFFRYKCDVTDCYNRTEQQCSMTMAMAHGRGEVWISQPLLCAGDDSN
jgi:hypothetical protein